MKVVRYSHEKIKALDLKPQNFNWGGFEATALCFCPFTDENDYRFTFWKCELEKYHKKALVANIYELDLSNCDLKTEFDLIKYGIDAYKNFDIQNFIKSIGLNITIIDNCGKKEIIEIRLYENCKIKIKDI